MNKLTDNQIIVLRVLIPTTVVIVLAVTLEHYCWKGRGITNIGAEIEKRVWR